MLTEKQLMERAIELALQAERDGNPPVGAVITLYGKVISEAGAANLTPKFDGTRHAEMDALRLVPENLWKLSHEMSIYTTLEPCLMCFSSILIHGIGRVVFGSSDGSGGASSVFSHLPPYFDKRIKITQWIGPVMAGECDKLLERLVVRLEKARGDAFPM
jgi:tRNA(adenine34) deaminase